MRERLIDIIPKQRTMHLAPSGTNAVCIVEQVPGTPEAVVEVRTAGEAAAVIDALVTAFALPALPSNFFDGLTLPKCG